MTHFSIFEKFSIIICFIFTWTIDPFIKLIQTFLFRFPIENRNLEFNPNQIQVKKAFLGV